MWKNLDWYYPTATSFSVLSQSLLYPQFCMNIHHSQIYFMEQPHFTWKLTLLFAEACPTPLCRFPRAQMRDLQKKSLRYLFIYAGTPDHTSQKV